MTKKILFVDDEQSLLNALSRRLGFDYDLVTADSGHRALEAIREEGPFAVVVTDMRMPEMDGVEFVKQARPIAPDAIYLMLTGNQDQETATKAVNEGQVFRFLNKPCENESLRNALDAALRQYELVTGEKELLKKTFCGAVGVLTDILEGSHPEFFSCSSSIEEIVGRLREHLRIEDHWEFHLASKLCLIGFTMMPEAERVAYLHSTALDPKWLKSLATASEIGQRMIKRIPRLETVAAIIGGQPNADGRTPWLPPESRSQVEMAGATLLRVAVEADHLARFGAEADEGVSQIKTNLPGLSPELEEALDAAWPDTAAQPMAEVAFKDLAEEMVLAEDVISDDGAVLVRKGRRLSATIIEKLRYHQNRVRSREHLMVFESSCQRAGQPLAQV